ncbi:MAG: HAD-IB family phosphatase [Patescibacteria group bacterium]|nr:HAD-IB family phosphatase [Patescibacteria group bacterium]
MREGESDCTTLMKPIAIFDIDGTIFRSSLTIELFNHLVAKGVFEPGFMKKVRASEAKWLNRQGHYENYVVDVAEAYKKAIVGKKKIDILAASRRVVAEQKLRTYRYTKHLLESIRGPYFTIGISGSPLEIVSEYNKFLKFDKVYGWEFGLDEKGRYTDVVLHVPPQYKRELIVRYVQNHGLCFKKSIGVGDTESDIGFLELVERPIAFNPNSVLARIARKNNWAVVTERKDLVLECNLKKVKILKV